MMIQNSKILILLTYYERPGLVTDFLRSLLAASEHYDNWELAFIDDGSQQPGRPLVERILKDHIQKVRFFNSEMTPDMKHISGGSFIGLYMNQAIEQSDAQIAIMAGDDDQIYPDYLKNLNLFFKRSPSVLSCYSNVNVYDPLKEKAANANNLYSNDPTWKGHAWFGKPINCAFKVDGIQVAWRTKCNKVHGAWFRYPIYINHDAEFFEELNARCKKSVYTGFVAMYKGRHAGQLIKRVEDGGGSFGEKKKVLDKPKKILFV
jgi:glycosyltransferase involved in cell wall biosynthesis